MTRFSAAVLTALCAACGGGSAATPDSGVINPGSPDAGGSGAATGRVGPAGGTIATADGTLTLEIPAGALAAATDVTLRPVASTAPNGIGLSYRIEPAGLVLAQPATLSFAVDEAALGEDTADQIGIAVRDGAGDWFADLGSVAGETSAKRAKLGPQAGGRVMLSTTLIFDGDDIFEVTVVTFWRVQPRRPRRVHTGESMPITVLACFQERSVPAGGNANAHRLAPSAPTCAPSIREGTWSVNGMVGGDAFGGRIVPGAPTSKATYTAPVNLPQLRSALVIASLFWRERGLTAAVKIPVTIEGSDVWTGTVTYTVSGNTTRTDPDGKVTTERRAGSGTLTLRARPGAVTQIGGVIDVESIVADEDYTLDERQESGTDSRGCTATTIYHENLRGNAALFPSGPLNPFVFLTLAENEYTVSFTGFLIDVAGMSLLQYISRCPGEGDVTIERTEDLSGTAGPDFSGGQSWTRPADPGSPGTLAGSASFTEPGPGWVTIDVTWTLSRP